MGILIKTQWRGIAGVLSQLIQQRKLAKVQDFSLYFVDVLYGHVLNLIDNFQVSNPQICFDWTVHPLHKSEG